MDLLNLAGILVSAVQPIAAEAIFLGSHYGWWLTYQIDRLKGARNG